MSEEEVRFDLVFLLLKCCRNRYWLALYSAAPAFKHIEKRGSLCQWPFNAS